MADVAHASPCVLASEWDALRDPPSGRWEILGGELVLTPSATPDHNDAAFALCAILRERVPPTLRVGIDLDWVLEVPGDPRFIVNAPRPDVVVWPRHHARVAEPVLAIEVLSPSDSGRIAAKRFAYALAGLPAYLEVDLDTGQLTRYQLANGALTIAESGATVTITLPDVQPFTVTIDQLRP